MVIVRATFSVPKIVLDIPQRSTSRGVSEIGGNTGIRGVDNIGEDDLMRVNQI